MGAHDRHAGRLANRPDLQQVPENGKHAHEADHQQDPATGGTTVCDTISPPTRHAANCFCRNKCR
eukprot:10073333-Alexandrium_andersonii.AAC.1